MKRFDGSGHVKVRGFATPPGCQTLLGVLEPLLQLLDLQLECMLPGHTAGDLLDG